MPFPSFPTVASERQMRTASPLALRAETPWVDKAGASSPTTRASQGEARRASTGMPQDSSLAIGDRRDELDLSPEALAFLLGAPPLAGSRETSNSADEPQGQGLSNPEQFITTPSSSEAETLVSVEPQENTAPAPEPSLGGTNETDAVPSSNEASDEETTGAATEESETSKRESDTEHKAKDSKQLAPEEEDLVERLADRDREVRTHEQAHMNAAGAYAQGGPTYTYQQGPDGKQYAVGGEVQIDTSPIPNDPEATIRKAQVVRAAALAPAEPSSQDKAVASAATKMQQAAQSELLQQRMEQTNGEENEEGGDNANLKSKQDTHNDATETSSKNSSPTASNTPSETLGDASDEFRGPTDGMPSTEPDNPSQLASESFDASIRESMFRNEASLAYTAQDGPALPDTRAMPRSRSEAYANPVSSPGFLDVRW